MINIHLCTSTHDELHGDTGDKVWIVTVNRVLFYRVDRLFDKIIL